MTGLAAVGLLTAVGAPAAGAGGSNKLTVKGGEYVYEFSGKPKPGNVEIVFDNAGIELHMMAVIGVKPSVTKKQLMKASMSNDQSALEKLLSKTGFNVSGTPGLLSPEQTTTTIANLPAGRYGVLCFVPTSEGVPHIAEGMVAVFDVKGSKSTLKPPKDGVVDVTVSDTGFTVPSSKLPRNGWLKVTNEAAIGRDVSLAKLEPGTTFEQADAAFDSFFETGQWPGGNPPAIVAGGFGSVAAGKSAYLEVENLDPGTWLLISSDDDGENEVRAEVQVS